MKEKKAGYAGWLGRMAAVLALFVLLLLPVSARADETPVLSKTKMTMVQLGTKTLKLKGAEADKVKWTTSNDMIAKVSAKGVVTARYQGTCRITAKYKGTRYVCQVTVKKLKLNKQKVTITAKRTVTLKLNNAQLSPVTWSSSNKRVATVSKKGVVRGRYAGTCTITAKYKKRTFKCQVTVLRNSYDSLRATNPVNEKNMGKVVLAGSSTLARWGGAAAAFAPLEILNMGISNSTVSDWMVWQTDLVAAYRPSAVVLYVGNNDIGNGDREVDGRINAENTILLIKQMQTMLPKNTPIFYVSLVPCWAREGAWQEIIESNRAMRKFCASQSKVFYIDVRSSFVTSSGRPRRALFLSDRMHPNANGYAIWRNIVAGRVKKALK